MIDQNELMRLADEMHKASPAGTDVHWKTLRRFSDRLRTLAQGAPQGMEVVGEIFMMETLAFDDQKEISHAHLFRELPNKTKLYAYTKPTE